MVDPVTSNMQFAVPTRGSDVGTWDTPLNGDWNIADSAFGGVVSISLSNVDVNLSVSQAQNAVIRFSGTLTNNVHIILPAIVKSWTMENLTSGAFVVQVTVGGQAIGLPPGMASQVYSDGTNVKFLNLGVTGKIEMWYTALLPAWVAFCTVNPFLICDGTTFNATTYPALNTILGGNTLPDLRGRMIASLNSASGRIIGGLPGGVDGNILGAGGGQSGHVLTSNELPVITPSGSVTIGSPSWPSGRPNRSTSSSSVSTQLANVNVPQQAGMIDVDFTLTGSFSGNAFGNNDPHNLMPPTLIAGLWMIKT